MQRCCNATGCHRHGYGCSIQYIFTSEYVFFDIKCFDICRNGMNTSFSPTNVTMTQQKINSLEFHTIIIHAFPSKFWFK